MTTPFPILPEVENQEPRSPDVGVSRWPWDIEPLYEGLRKRHPRAANVDIGVALLKAERNLKSAHNMEALLDEAEACLLNTWARSCAVQH